MRDEIVNADVFVSSKLLRERNIFQREDGTPLYYTLVNIQDWCKNEFEVINQLRINTDNSHYRYDVILLLNGIPVIQIELKVLEVSPRRAMQQIVDYKTDPGNGYCEKSTIRKKITSTTLINKMLLQLYVGGYVYNFHNIP